jgi:hypothetical protein
MLAGTVFFWDYAYAWYNLIGVVLGIPLTLTGWLLYQKKTEKRVKQFS